jgi:hypothetical protein
MFNVWLEMFHHRLRLKKLMKHHYLNGNRFYPLHYNPFPEKFNYLSEKKI